MSAEEAIVHLWLKYAAGLRRLARNMVPAADVDDVVSEAFCAVFKALSNGSGPSDDRRGYLVVTVRRAARVALERNAAAARSEAVAAASVVAVGEWGPADPDGALAAAFGAVSLRHRQILWATAVEGFDPKDIGHLFELDSRGVSALAYRARNSLRCAYLAQS